MAIGWLQKLGQFASKVGSAIQTGKKVYETVKEGTRMAKQIADPLMKTYVTPALLNYGGETGEKIASAYQTGSSFLDKFLN